MTVQAGESFKTYQAALYIRLSKEDETQGESQSITNQRGLLTAFAAQQGIKIAETFVDDGYSGTTFERPGFVKMLAAIEQRRINLVLTKDLSRLGRDYIQTGYYLERYFPEHGVRYISLLDGIDTGKETAANDITPFRAILNDFYAKDISAKIKSVKRDKQKKGLFIGGKAAYGYKLSPDEKNKIIVDEPAAHIVRKIFSLAAKGESCRRIAAVLNERGIPPPAVYANLPQAKNPRYNGQWSAERVSFILKNELYIGNMVQGRTQKISYKSKKSRKNPPESWAVVPGTHEPIIDTELFYQVQRLLEGRAHTRERTHYSPLKGLVYCHECGQPMGLLCRTYQGKQTLYFTCASASRKQGTPRCLSYTPREDEMMHAVMAQLETHIQTLGRPQLLSAAAALLEARGGIGKRRQSDAQQLEILSVQMQRAYLDRLEGLIEEQDFQRVYETLKKKRNSLQKSESSPRNNAAEDSDAAERYLNAFLESIPTNSALLAQFVRRIEPDREKNLHLYLRFRP